jgi:hypothetical protein
MIRCHRLACALFPHFGAGREARLAGQTGRLTAYGIVHSYDSYDGDHLNRVESRFETKVLPFFAVNLEFNSAARKGSKHD